MRKNARRSKVRANFSRPKWNVLTANAIGAASMKSVSATAIFKIAPRTISFVMGVLRRRDFHERARIAKLAKSNSLRIEGSQLGLALPGRDREPDFIRFPRQNGSALV